MKKYINSLTRRAKIAFGIVALCLVAVFAATTDGSIADLLTGSSIVTMAAAPLVSFKSKFETFDAERFNPSGETSLIAIKISNSSATAQRVELFNAFKSASMVYNASLNSGVYPNTYDKIAIAVSGATGTPTKTNLMFFDNAGDMYIYNSTGTEYSRIQCTTQNLTYRQLFEASRIYPGFTISNLLISFTTDAQIDNEITFFENSIFGKVTSDSVSPRRYFDPSQYQSKLIQIPLNFVVTGEKGLQFLLNGSETVTINMDVTRNAA